MNQLIPTARPPRLPAADVIQPQGQTPRPSAAKRGYNAAWAKKRADYLADHPHCVQCKRRGRTELSTVVDHIKPLRDGGADHTSNYQALCATCHSSWKQRQDNAARRAAQSNDEAPPFPQRRPSEPRPLIAAARELKQQKEAAVKRVCELCEQHGLDLDAAAAYLKVPPLSLEATFAGDVGDRTILDLRGWAIRLLRYRPQVSG